MKPQASFLGRIFNASIYSAHGVYAAFKEEAAFRQVLGLSLFLIVILLILPFSTIERVILIIPLGISIITELLNSAIENVVDLASPDIHPLAKKAKDMGSAAQMAALILIFVVWSLVLWNHFKGSF